MNESSSLNNNNHNNVTKFGFIPKSFSFGLIQSINSDYCAKDSHTLHNNVKCFTFYVCDIQQMLHNQIHLPYIPSSIAFNDFILLSNHALYDWKPQSLFNPNFLNHIDVLRRISICLFDRIKLISQQCLELQTEIEQKNFVINNLTHKLRANDAIYVVCCI